MGKEFFESVEEFFESWREDKQQLLKNLYDKVFMAPLEALIENTEELEGGGYRCPAQCSTIAVFMTKSDLKLHLQKECQRTVITCACCPKLILQDACCGPSPKQLKALTKDILNFEEPVNQVKPKNDEESEKVFAKDLGNRTGPMTTVMEFLEVSDIVTL